MAENTPQPERLTALNDRRTTVRLTRREQAYSGFVKKLRWALPVLAMGILLVLMVWPRIDSIVENMRFKAPPIDKKALEQAATENRLLNADFSSVDSQGRPYHILADQAVQQNKDPNRVVLIRPNGTLKAGEADTITLKGDHGLFQQDTHYLTLTDNVVMTRSDGSVMKTSVLHMDLSTNSAQTDQPVAIDGPQGSIRAQGMDSRNGGATTVFTGPAKLILNNNGSSLKGGI
jgi:lipopolysaccharide export system protein LptC